MQSHSLAGSRQRPRLAAAAARSTARSRGRAPPAAAYQPRSTPISSTDSDVSDIINLAKHRMARKQQAAEVPQGPLGDFLHKVHLAWRIFFPEQVGAGIGGCADIGCRRGVGRIQSGSRALTQVAGSGAPHGGMARPSRRRDAPPAPSVPPLLLASEQQRELTPKEEGKQRLRMILVADR